MLGRLCTALLLLAAIALPSVASAGGPFVDDVVNGSGTALQWTDRRIVLYYDTGVLSASPHLSNATAVSSFGQTSSYASEMSVHFMQVMSPAFDRDRFSMFRKVDLAT